MRSARYGCRRPSGSGAPARRYATRVDALAGAVSEPAWKTKPSWYLVATDDRMIPPPARRAMAERAGATVTEAPGSHSIYLSQPQAVADVIRQAAAGVSSRPYPAATDGIRPGH